MTDSTTDTSTATATALTYSRRVGLLKVALPLVALGLLSSLFLVARTIDPAQAIQSAPIDVEDRARDPRLSGARFAGVTDDGASLTLRADTARTDPGGALRLEVSGLELRLETATGTLIAARADLGVLDRARGVFQMEGSLELQTAQGYRLQAPRLMGALDTTRVIAPDGVEGQAPAGTIRAGRLELVPVAADGAAGGSTQGSEGDSGPDSGYVLVFRDGVRLNYQPQD